jgi:hypothetical protein
MKLNTNHPKVKRINNCSKEGPGSFPRGRNHLRIFAADIQYN